MKKVLLFWRLYFHALIRFLRNGKPEEIEGVSGTKVFRFFDPEYPESGRHGVVAFVLPYGTRASDYSPDLLGPFGYTSQIDLEGKHLYGRDTWGIVTTDQLIANPLLAKLARRYPHQHILLAGVRQFIRWHLPPLNNPRAFVLVYKDPVWIALR